MYGYGSKKAVLDRLGADELTDGGVLAVNGWAHSLTIRSLLLRVIGMLRKSGLQSTSLVTCLSVLHSASKAWTAFHLMFAAA